MSFLLDVMEEDGRVPREKGKGKTNNFLVNLRGRTSPIEPTIDPEAAQREGDDSKAKLLSDQDKEKEVDKRV